MEDCDFAAPNLRNSPEGACRGGIVCYSGSPLREIMTSSGDVAAPMQQLVGLLDLEPIEENIFRGTSPQDRSQRVFGGQVLGQALVAATRTVQDRSCHSLHAYFLLDRKSACRERV